MWVALTGEKLASNDEFVGVLLAALDLVFFCESEGLTSCIYTIHR